MPDYRGYLHKSPNAPQALLLFTPYVAACQACHTFPLRLVFYLVKKDVSF